jgi:CRP/FNR family transcriptional regulator, cyclic AMP receptor protein
MQAIHAVMPRTTQAHSGLLESLPGQAFGCATSHGRAMLSRLPEELSRHLFAAAVPCRLKAGKSLFVMGDRGDGCYRLERGLLKVVVTSPYGEERILAFLAVGSIAGELALIDAQPRSASVIAVEDCELSFISQAAFAQIVEQKPDICRYLVNVLAARLREANEALAAASFLTVKARVASALVALGELFGEPQGADHIVIRYKINQNDLAAMVGTGRENVSRVLSGWKKRKIVTRSSGCWRLDDIAALRHSMHS